MTRTIMNSPARIQRPKPFDWRYHIRWMTKSDLPGVLDIESRTAPCPWGEEDYRRMLPIHRGPTGMKLELHSFAHSENGLSLHVVPESDEEAVLLKALWKHGKMELCPAGVDRGPGCCVSWNMREMEKTA